MPNKATAEKRAAVRDEADETTQSFIDAGFKPKSLGKTTIYYRPTPKDVLEITDMLVEGRAPAERPKKAKKA
ncbi:MAG TPA: hypothetical protein VF546_03070 [Pyrinomonadaceae bacterium]|jgi:hypothetical protein